MLRTDPTKYVKQTMLSGPPSAILRSCPDPGAVVGPGPRLWMSDKTIGRSGTDGNPALRGDLTRLRAALPLAGPPHHRGLAHPRRALARPAALRPLHPRPLRARRPLARAANWYYVAGFLPVLVLAAALAAWRAPAAFASLRRVFSVSLVLALVGFAVFPVAPPRLLGADRGFVDTLLAYGPRYYGDAHGSGVFNAGGRLPSLVNVYAAMPSMHVAWSAVAGALLAVAIGRRWARALAVLHPAAMAFAVVVTGNHYVLDVLGGLLVLGLAITFVLATGHSVVRRIRVVRPMGVSGCLGSRD